MTSGSATERLEIFIASAGIAAHASFADNGFRLRDLRFFTELFLNWTEDGDTSQPSLQNTQLARYIAQLVAQGFAKRSSRNGVTTFRLTRLGLLELLSRITSSSSIPRPSIALFRVCFIKSYKARLEALVAREGAQFPLSVRLELSALLDVDTLIDQEIKRVERALQRIERRIEDALEASALTKNRLATHMPFSDVVQEVESRFPYELNTTKPLRELIASIAPDQRRWELEEGNALRARTLWEPHRALLRELLNQLKKVRG